MFYSLKALNFLYLAMAWRVTALPTSSEKNRCISQITWNPCPEDGRFDCGSIDVPLDYAYPAKGNATLGLARLKSQSWDRKGSILTNPGGPGVSGVDFLISRAGDLISNITDGKFDVISWDPRGVNHSRPLVTCGFSTAESFQDFFGDSILIHGIEARGNFTNENDLASLFSKVNDTDDLLVKVGQQCVDANGDFLQYVGTTSTARDMLSIWDSIEEQGSPVNYWGFSYGTVIGNYFVNMFPQRVGRVILDGVVDAVGWATEPSIAQTLVTVNDAEKALLGFSDGCASAGPVNCSIAQANSTGQEIFLELEALINNAYNLTHEGLNNVTSFDVRKFLWDVMFFPAVWSDIAVPEIELFQSVLQSEAKALKSGQRPREIPSSSDAIIDPNVASFVSELAITCVDSVDQPEITTQRVFEAIVNASQQVSPLFGEILITEALSFCHRFPVRAVERFTGPFDHQLAYPILVIGNEADPVTPFANAKKIANILGSSARLVKQDGFGHTSIAMNSDCTQSIVRNYFLNGTLPEDGVICLTDQALFPPNMTIIISSNPFSV